MKKTLLHISKVMIGVGIALLLSEILVRLVGYGNPEQKEVIDDRVRKYRPNQSWVQNNERQNLVRLNNFGFHDIDRTVEPGAGRIVVLGNSFVEALQVPVDSTFTRRVEREMQKTSPSIQVLNAGISYAGTAYEYALWRWYLQPVLRPTHVVVCMSLGDDLENNNAQLNDLAPYYYQISLDSSGAISINTPNYSFIQRMARELREHSMLVSMVYYRLYRLKKQHLAEEWEQARQGELQHSPIDSASWKSTVAGTIALLLKWKSEAEQYNSTFSVVVIQGHEYWQKGFYSISFKNVFLDEIRKRASVGELDLFELDFSRFRPEEIFSFDGHTLGHFNFKGHATAAEQLFPWLIKRRGSSM